MMILQPGILSQGGKKYTWERYSVTRKETAGSSSQFTLLATDYVYYSRNSYTVNGDEYELKSPTYDTANKLSVTSYNPYCIVDYGKTKSGSTLMKITNLNGYASTITVTYTPYTVKSEKGSLIDTVKSNDPSAYPENGIQDGYWYVLRA